VEIITSAGYDMFVNSCLPAGRSVKDAAHIPYPAITKLEIFTNGNNKLTDVKPCGRIALDIICPW
jgi:hypothetical protein